MFENPRRGMQARNFATNVPKILDLKSSSEHWYFPKIDVGCPCSWFYDPEKDFFQFTSLCGLSNEMSVALPESLLDLQCGDFSCTSSLHIYFPVWRSWHILNDGLRIKPTRGTLKPENGVSTDLRECELDLRWWSHKKAKIVFFLINDNIYQNWRSV